MELFGFLMEAAWTLIVYILRARVHAQLHLTLCDPLDCTPPGFSVYGILQERILEWVAMSFSKSLEAAL